MKETKIYGKCKETLISELNIFKEALSGQQRFEMFTFPTALCFTVSSLNYEVCKHTQNMSMNLCSGSCHLKG